MLIKQADDKADDLRVLEGLLAHPAAKARLKERIEEQIWSIRAGTKGEKDAAYEIDFHYGPQSKNWAVIHDLRIEHKGRVAQIDHLLVNRFLEIWVCESKRFGAGIAINEHGEYATFRDGNPIGVPSPVEQNRKHCTVLREVFDDGAVELPRRLGIAMKPDIRSLVLISTDAVIMRPRGKVEGLDEIVKVDQVKARIVKSFDEPKGIMTAAKIIGSDTLEDFAKRLAAIHRPAKCDWHARFGLRTAAAADSADAWHARMTAPPHKTAGRAEEQPVPAASAKAKWQNYCCACAKPVTSGVAKFCWSDKPRFGGKVYCMDCQKTVPAAG